jgi:hypothetical protein
MHRQTKNDFVKRLTDDTDYQTQPAKIYTTELDKQ